MTEEHLFVLVLTGLVLAGFLAILWLAAHYGSRDRR